MRPGYPQGDLVDAGPPPPYHDPVRQIIRIAVFGRADVTPGTQGYSEAFELGGLIAREGWVVLTGGYGGVMEAASRGAAEAGGECEGVLCRAFSGRKPNPFLTRQVWAADLWERTRLLVDMADAYVALEPRAGTLAEVVNLWTLRKAGHLPSRPLVLVGSAWDAIAETFGGLGTIERNLLQWSVRVTGPQEAVSVLREAPLEETAHGQS